MEVRVLFFGEATERTGLSIVQVAGQDTVEELKKFLFKTYPRLNDFLFSIAVNKEIIKEDTVKLKDQDEVAILPPFSGG